MSSSTTYTVAVVAIRYGVSTATVLHWIGTGQLRALAVGRRAGARRPTWRVTEAALAAFEAARTLAPAAPRARRRRQSADVIQFYA